MIKLLQRYIAKTIIFATCLASAIITSVLFLTTLLGEMKNIGEGDYGMGQAVIYVLLRLPNELYQFSPLFILLGSIIGLSILSSHRELAVMRASGFAIRQIIYSVLSAALILIVVISFMGEWVGPHLSHKAEIRKENARNAGMAVVTAAGIWFHIDHNFIHVQREIGRQLLEGVTWYQFDNRHRLQAAYYAKTLSFKDDQWTMNEVVKTSFYDERTKSRAYPSVPWPLTLNANLLKVGIANPHEMSLPKLVEFAHYLQQNGLQASEYLYNFWQRLFQPLASLVMIFLAIPFVLGALSTSTIGWRIIIGVMTGFSFFILNALLGQLCVVFQLPTLIAALLPPFLFALLGMLLSNRLIRR